MNDVVCSRLGVKQLVVFVAEGVCSGGVGTRLFLRSPVHLHRADVVLHEVQNTSHHIGSVAVISATFCACPIKADRFGTDGIALAWSGLGQLVVRVVKAGGYGGVGAGVLCCPAFDGRDAVVTFYKVGNHSCNIGRLPVVVAGGGAGPFDAGCDRVDGK